MVVAAETWPTAAAVASSAPATGALERVAPALASAEAVDGDGLLLQASSIKAVGTSIAAAVTQARRLRDDMEDPLERVLA
jgi:hypothetical protein